MKSLRNIVEISQELTKALMELEVRLMDALEMPKEVSTPQMTSTSKRGLSPQTSQGRRYNADLKTQLLAFMGTRPLKGFMLGELSKKFKDDYVKVRGQINYL